MDTQHPTPRGESLVDKFIHDLSIESDLDIAVVALVQQLHASGQLTGKSLVQALARQREDWNDAQGKCGNLELR